MAISPRVLVLRAPGTNCDIETAFAFEAVGGQVHRMHVNQLIEHPRLGREYQILCFPGGFSYGDDIAAGRILAQRITTHLQDLAVDFTSQDRLILGICNGFQVLMRLGIFFPDSEGGAPASLALNRQARFEDRWVHLTKANSNCVFLKNVETLYLPMAHAEGRFVIDSPESAERLKPQLALRYTDSGGLVSDEAWPYPINPNGSQLNVAGISDPTGRILGMMPHPERFMEPTQHPFWTRFDGLPEHGEGRIIFQNAVDYFR
jgi:phosphoribosylformylglycinamidine synthase subunit PurQ / glutaminase